MNAVIAQHLNIAESLIAEVQEWAHVLWVRVKGLGARFVSKKIAKMTETLPALKGTEKQVEWAEDIRRQLMADVEEFKSDKADKMQAPPRLKRKEQGLSAQEIEQKWRHRNEKLQKEIERITDNLSVILQNDDATFWIEKRLRFHVSSQVERMNLGSTLNYLILKGRL
ncbi:MAG: hypothetical protein AAGD09_03195 [Cyanobacteria bacterium P01_F01_bin.56]